MDITVKFHLTLDMPQLEKIGRQIVANLSSISAALDTLSDTLENELQQIADALRDSPSDADVEAVAQRVISLKDRIANIIP